MNGKTRKHNRPVSLAMMFVVVGMLAAFVASAAFSGVASAQDPPPPPPPPPAPTPALDQNQAPELTGSTLGDVSLRIQQSSGPIPIADAFRDPDEDDTLTYTASSDNPNVANASIAGSQMTIIAGDIRGSARITVTAADGKGGTVSTSFTVTVAEAYTLTAKGSGDPNLPEPPTDSGVDDQYAGLRDIPNSAIHLVHPNDDYPNYDAHFSLGVAGSLDDVTVTVTASEILNISIVDSDGLIGAGFVDAEETDLEGSLTVKATDRGSRAFEIEGVCESLGGWAQILVEDKDLQEVAKGAIYCKPMDDDVVVADPDEFRSDVMSVVSYNDWDHWERYETVSDGFIIVDSDAGKNVEHVVNQDNKMTGILVRDEPVAENYQLAISSQETLTLKAGASPNRLTKAQAEAGQHTIEVMVGAHSVQLTVTSTMEGPAYIRFLDSDQNPFGADVDEDPKWRGADVVGLDSQGRLDLNLTPELTEAKALAYDQYRVIIPGAADADAYLMGLGGKYHQGAFRVINPCPSLGHHFYVEVYEASGKYLKTTEKVMCVSSPRPGPTGLVFEIDSQKPGEGVLRFTEARNADKHTVLLINAKNRNIVSTSADAASPVIFDNLNNGWSYHIVVLAQGVDDHFTAHAVRDYGVRWLGAEDVPLSTDPPAKPTRQHNLCKVDDADITALLSDCDKEPVSSELTAPTGVTARADDSDPGNSAIEVTWTPGENAMGHMVLVFTDDFSLPYWDASPGAGSSTIENVAAGSYTVVVVSYKSSTDYKYASQTISVGQ